MPRELDPEFVEVVRLFRGRRRWRHVLAMIIGAAALILGTAVVAAHLTHRDQAGLPSLGAGAGLYAAGALLAGWGAAAGFTSRLGRWLPATVVFGVLAVLVFVLAAVFSSDTNSLTTNGNTTSRNPRYIASPGRVLAAELLDRSDIERLLGAVPADLQTPGAKVARTRSMAIWRAAQAGVRPARQAAVSLTVQYSPRRARRLVQGGRIRHHDGSLGRVTRVRAGRGDWVVALQLRTGVPGDPAPLLSASVSHMLGLLTAASGPSGRA
jgi:hypothetical protein